jgi:hypothetical protein
MVVGSLQGLKVMVLMQAKLTTRLAIFLLLQVIFCSISIDALPKLLILLSTKSKSSKIAGC